MSNNGDRRSGSKIKWFHSKGGVPVVWTVLLLLVTFFYNCNSKDSANDNIYEEVWPASPVLRRLTPDQIRASIDMLLGKSAGTELKKAGHLPKPAKLYGLSVLGGAELSYNRNDLEKIEFGLRNAIEAGFAEFKTGYPCLDSVGDRECISAVLGSVIKIAWRRPASEPELEKILAITSAQEADISSRVRAGLLAILSSPNFLYIVELGADSKPNGEPRLLSGLELVTRLSLFLQGRLPDANTLANAEALDVKDSEAIGVLAETMLADPSTRRSLTNYFLEFLNLDVDLIAKDMFLFPEFVQVAPFIIEEVRRNLEHSIWQAEDFREFLLSKHTFVNANLAAYYRVEKKTNTDWERVELPASQKRAGFFAGLGFLARNSHVGSNSPTRRGHTIMAKFMCLEVPPPPQDVMTTLPAPVPGLKLTLRQRLEGHMDNDQCRGCHQVMDRIGFVLENYDAAGLFRSQDELHLPVDPVVSIPGFGRVTNSFELAQKVTDSDEFAKCIPKNLTKQATGNRRLPLLFEGQELGDKFKASGYNLKSLLVHIAMSKSFRYIKVDLGQGGIL